MDLKTRIMKAFTDDANFPNPSSVETDDESITVSWDGNHEGIASAAGLFIQRHSFNYIDPRPGGADGIVVDKSERHYTVTWPKFSLVKYDDAITEMIAKQSNGVSS